MSERERGYSQGYYAGSRGRWTAHRPPTPPHEIMGPLVEAAKSLRDQVAATIATFSEDDEVVTELGPVVDAFDQEMTRMTDWIRQVRRCDDG